MLRETIIAVSTPLGYGGLGIVRLSGGKSLSIAKKIFKPRAEKYKKIPERRPILGSLYDFENKEFFEEAYLTYFAKPHTYTREDVVEISCHGSPIILEEVVRLGIKAGARHAHPGEFTVRAYLNGRIDIIQAEAVNDLIGATSLNQAKISFRQLEGKLSQKIKSFRGQIVHILAQIEAAIEFPEEGLRISVKQIQRELENIVQSLKKLIESYDTGKTLAEGLTIAITGRTNVGKSTLFNSLLGKDRAIVTPYPGTTRDYLRETIKIKDSVFTLVDMAGLGIPSHPIEEEGIKKGAKLASRADGLLLVLDTSRKESSEDLKLINKFKNKKAILVFNKIDLSQNMDKERVKRLTKKTDSIEISALQGTNLDKLKDLIHKLFVPPPNKGEEVILHLRQKLLLEEILAGLASSLTLLKKGYSEEIYVEEIRKVIPLIGQLTGEIHQNNILEDIFKRFCVGK
jgi:tRNA modification GTPase